MKSLQALREQRGAKAKEALNLLDPAVTTYTKEVAAQVDEIYASIDLIDGQIRQIERSIVLGDDDATSARVYQDQRGGSVDHATHQVKAAKATFVKALRCGVAGLTPEEASLVSADVPHNLARVKNVALNPTTAGGVLVPTIIMPSLLERLKAFGGMREVAYVQATDGGNPITWGTIDDTAAEGEIVAEGVPAADDDLVFGTTSIGAYKFSSKTIPVSLEIIQDSAVDVESVVLSALSTRIARGQNRYFTTGTGTGQPQGVVTAAALGVTLPTGNTTSITYDGLIDLFHSIDPAYRGSASCAWMMNDGTFKAIKKLKDAQNRPLWLPTTDSAFNLPNGTIENRRIVINQHMADMAANAKPVLFGDFSKYMIRDVMDVLILRFTDSAYAKKAQVGFLAWARADGRMIDATNTSIKYLANSAT